MLPQNNHTQALFQLLGGNDEARNAVIATWLADGNDLGTLAAGGDAAPAEHTHTFDDIVSVTLVDQLTVDFTGDVSIPGFGDFATPLAFTVPLTADPGGFYFVNGVGGFSGTVSEGVVSLEFASYSVEAGTYTGTVTGTVDEGGTTWTATEIDLTEGSFGGTYVPSADPQGGLVQLDFEVTTTAQDALDAKPDADEVVAVPAVPAVIAPVDDAVALNSVFDNTEVEAAINALATAVNALATALDAVGLVVVDTPEV